jgi:hypothetical protein
LGTAGITALRACTGLIHNDPYCLYCLGALICCGEGAALVFQNDPTVAQVDVNVKGD